MALKIYEWRGHTWQIDDADLALYPGAVPVEAKARRTRPTKAELAAKLTNPELAEAVRAKEAAAGKAAEAPANKARPARRKGRVAC